MNRQLAVLGVGSMVILSACTPPDDQYDSIFTEPVAITATPLNAKIGEEIKVTLTVKLGLDERSSIPEKPISDIRLGVCFYDSSSGGEFMNSQGFCFTEIEELPSSYQMLNGTEYTKRFDDIVVQRGETLEFKHTFTFTLTEKNKLALEPHFEFVDDLDTVPPETGSGNIPENEPTVTFE